MLVRAETADYGQFGAAETADFGQFGGASMANFGQYGGAETANFGQLGGSMQKQLCPNTNVNAFFRYRFHGIFRCYEVNPHVICPTSCDAQRCGTVHIVVLQD